MKQRLFSYFLLAIVFSVSLWAALLAQKTEALGILFAAPGVAALFGVLLQLSRDQAASERASAAPSKRSADIQSRRGLPYGKHGI